MFQGQYLLLAVWSSSLKCQLIKENIKNPDNFKPSSLFLESGWISEDVGIHDLWISNILATNLAIGKGTSESFLICILDIFEQFCYFLLSWNIYPACTLMQIRVDASNSTLWTHAVIKSMKHVVCFSKTRPLLALKRIYPLTEILVYVHICRQCFNLTDTDFYLMYSMWLISTFLPQWKWYMLLLVYMYC